MVLVNYNFIFFKTNLAFQDDCKCGLQNQHLAEDSGQNLRRTFLRILLNLQ